MPKSALASAISTLRMMSRKSGKSRAIVLEEREAVRVRLDELLQSVAHAEVCGDEWRDCIQPKTQGMARRSAMLRFFAELASVRLAGREPMRACSSSATGVACSK